MQPIYLKMIAIITKELLQITIEKQQVFNAQLVNLLQQEEIPQNSLIDTTENQLFQLLKKQIQEEAILQLKEKLRSLALELQRLKEVLQMKTQKKEQKFQHQEELYSSQFKSQKKLYKNCKAFFYKTV